MITLIFEAHGTTFDNEAHRQRAYKSAEIGFGNKWPIIQDKRLRECDYGDLTQKRLNMDWRTGMGV